MKPLFVQTKELRTKGTYFLLPVQILNRIICLLAYISDINGTTQNTVWFQNNSKNLHREIFRSGINLVIDHRTVFCCENTP